jgi:trehalose synthase
MTSLSEVQLAPRPIARFLPILGADAVREAEQVATAIGARLAGRVVWHVNSTARGGGVAEMLQSLLG